MDSQANRGRPMPSSDVSFAPSAADPRSRALDESDISDLSDLYHQDQDASRLVRAGYVSERGRQPHKPAHAYERTTPPAARPVSAQVPPRISSLEHPISSAIQPPQTEHRGWRDPYASAPDPRDLMEDGEPERSRGGDVDLEKAFPATYGNTADAYASNGHSLKQPLINRITNEWREQMPARGRRRLSSASSDSDDDDNPCTTCLGICASRICRRYILVLVVFIVWMSFSWVRWWGPEYGETARLKASIREALERERGYWGINVRASFPGLDAIRPLERWKVPGSKVQRNGPKPKSEQRRLIIVGDIHGCVDELKELLHQTSFNPETDHIIAAGDMIARGPSSVEVVDLLMKHNASCVRGNHEERVVLTRRDWKSPAHHKVHIEGLTAPEPLKKGPRSDVDLAAALSDEQANWLRDCPLVLDLGQIPGLGRTAVAHAGLVPLVPLHLQDPFSVQTMRAIDLRTHAPVMVAPPGRYLDRWSDKPGKQYVTVEPKRDVDRYGRPWVVPWPKLWDVAQNVLPSNDRTTVIYGHDENVGLTSTSWTMGLDAGCVRGGELAALVLSGTVSGTGSGERVKSPPGTAAAAGAADDNGRSEGWTIPGTGSAMGGAIDLGMGKMRDVGGKVKGIALGAIGKGVRREIVRVPCKRYADAAIGAPPLGDS